MVSGDISAVDAPPAVTIASLNDFTLFISIFQFIIFSMIFEMESLETSLYGAFKGAFISESRTMASFL